MIQADYSPVAAWWLDSKGFDYYDNGLIIIDDMDQESEKQITDFLDENGIGYVVD